jgi:hypothetical protein
MPWPHALTHERVDVQERAWAMIVDLVPEPGRRRELAGSHADALAPSLQPDSQPVAAIEPTRDRPPDAAPLEPVADVDELGELLARLAEEADDPAEVERLLDGVARMPDQRPTRGVDALIKRLHALADAYVHGAWSGEELRADIVHLGIVWLTGRTQGPGYLGRQYAIDYEQRAGVLGGVARHRPDWSLAGLVTMRVHEVSVGLRSGGGPLLSFPTRRDGTLDAEMLNVRVRSTSRRAEPRPLDAGLAVLRVPPEQHSQLRFPRSHRTARFLQDQLDQLRAHRPSWELVTGDSTGFYPQRHLPRGRHLERPGISARQPRADGRCRARPTRPSAEPRPRGRRWRVQGTIRSGHRHVAPDAATTTPTCSPLMHTPDSTGR